MTEQHDDAPNVALHPPTVFFCSLLIGYIIRLFAGGLLPLPHVWAEGIGGALVLFALAIALLSVTSFAEAGEELRPATPSKQLFTHGPFKYSRNPIYLAMVVFGVGFGIATLNLWMILTAIAAGLIFHFFVIPHEEEYLKRKFGDDYDAYRNKVRRWL